jgi:Fe-S cluster assembly ATP-binding protein
MSTLEVKNLNVSIDGQAILKDFSLTIPKGEVHALMGPNGTGKSTLAKVMAGHEDYEVESGDILLDGESILGKEADEISHAGLFLAFQYPLEIPGVSIANFIRAARAARLPEGEEINAVAYYKELYEKMDALKMDRKFTARSLNEGFSGGEKKRCEILQMSMLDPKYCVMDETDSGLDIDALKIVSEGVNLMRSPDRGFLVITHYQRLLDYIVPDVVHVMFDGRIVHSGDAELAKELESKGYDWVKESFAGASAGA